MRLTIDTMQPTGGDVLLIRAHDDAGNEYEASGWLSATTNHYPAEGYSADGHRADGATARPMSADELGAYALALLLAANPQLVDTAADEPAPLDFVTPEAAATIATPAQPEPVSATTNDEQA